MVIQTLKICIISGIIAIIISLGLNSFSLEKVYANFWYISVLFHIVVSFLLNLVLFGNKAAPADFIFKIMFTSMGRLLLCMVGVFIYSLFEKATFVQFSIHFMLHYIVFAILEIIYLLKFVKLQKS